jgi:hypothetical protein
MSRIIISAITVAFLAACGGGIGDSQKRLRTAIEGKQDALDDCYEKSLTRSAETAGNLNMLVKVAKKSGSISAKAAGGKIADNKLVQCVETAVNGVKLSPAPKSNMEVTYTFTFAPEG